MNTQDNGLGAKKTNLSQSNIGRQTGQVLDETKKLGNEIYNEGKTRFDELQGNIKEGSDRLIAKVQEKPLFSLLIAAGIGFILSRLMSR